MKIENILIGIAIVAIVFTTSTVYLGSLGENYDVTYENETLDRTLYEVNNYTSDYESLSDDITSITLEDPIDFISVPYQLIKVGWKILKQTFNSWNFFTDIMRDISAVLISELGLPAYIPGLVISIFVISLVFILIYGFFKWRFNNEGV